MLKIFLQPSATDSQVDAVRRRLASMTDLESVRFVDKQEAHEEIKVLFADFPGTIEHLDLGDAPVSFRVLPKPMVDRQVVGARLAGYGGVLNIVYPDREVPDLRP